MQASNVWAAMRLALLSEMCRGSQKIARHVDEGTRCHEFIIEGEGS